MFSSFYDDAAQGDDGVVVEWWWTGRCGDGEGVLVVMPPVLDEWWGWSGGDGMVMEWWWC